MNANLWAERRLHRDMRLAALKAFVLLAIVQAPWLGVTVVFDSFDPLSWAMGLGAGVTGWIVNQHSRAAFEKEAIRKYVIARHHNGDN